MSNEVEDYDEEEVEVAVAPACIASEGYALTVADNTWAGNFGGRGITMTQVFLKPGNEQELSTSQLMVNQVRQVWAENQTEMLRTPKLITELVNQTKLFETMTNNWDREGAIAPTTDAINQLGMFFQKVFNYISFELAVPGISASKNGGIYLFWDDENVNIEVKIPPTIGEDIEVFIQNPSKGFIYDGKLHPEIEQRIYELVSKMKISLELPIA